MIRISLILAVRHPRKAYDINNTRICRKKYTKGFTHCLRTRKPRNNIAAEKHTYRYFISVYLLQQNGLFPRPSFVRNTTLINNPITSEGVRREIRGAKCAHTRKRCDTYRDVKKKHNCFKGCLKRKKPTPSDYDEICRHRFQIHYQRNQINLCSYQLPPFFFDCVQK